MYVPSVRWCTNDWTAARNANSPVAGLLQESADVSVDALFAVELRLFLPPELCSRTEEYYSMQRLISTGVNEEIKMWGRPLNYAIRGEPGRS